MSLRKIFIAPAIMIMVCTGLANESAAASAPDANVVTQYAAPGGKSIIWSVCGAIPNEQGCFGNGTLSGLTQPCSMTEGPKTVVTDTPSQYITTTPVYVLDAGSTTGAKLTLDVYTRTQNTQSSSVTTTFTLASKVVLPVVAGPTAVCSMAANGTTLAAGTNLDSNAVTVTLKNLKVFSFGSFSPPITLSAITESDNGYLSMQYGTGSNTAFIEVAPDGSIPESGGGSAFLLNPRSGVTLSTTGGFSGLTKPAARTSYHPAQE